MSFDKEKVRRAAEKNLTQGKIQAAIRDYCQIVEHDHKDYNTLNTLGDLYVRMNSKDEATVCFKRIAEYYEAQGFTHKAIAMYKKMLRLVPKSVEIAAKLAPLYQTLGLVAEARTFYLLVAEDSQAKGEQLKVLEVWSRIADLDPNDTAVRLKLAENFRRENQPEQAAQAFAEAGNRLLAKKQAEPALAAFNQALELAPLDLAALSGFANSNIALGFPDEAAAPLIKVLHLHYDNHEILALLANVYVAAGNAELAEEYVGKLVEREPTSYTRYLDVARLYLKDNNAEDAARVLGFCGEMFISNNQEDELLVWLNEVLARDPEQLTALRLLARVRAWQRNEDELKIALERLAESAQLNNDQAEERSALVELNTLFPEDDRYAARLREIDPQSDAARTNPPHPQHESVPTFESFNSFDEESADAFQAHSFSQFDRYDQEDWQNQSGAAESGRGNDFAEQNAAAFAESGSHDLHNQPESADEPTFAFHSNSFQDEFENQTRSRNQEADFNFDATATETGFANNQSDESAAVYQAAKNDHLLATELEGVDFYVSQGLSDIALESLAQLETQFGATAEIEKRREQCHQISIANKTAAQAAPPAENQADSHYEELVDNPAAQLQNEVAAELENAAPKTVEPVQPIVPLGAISLNGMTAANGFEDLFAEFDEGIEVANLSTVQTADYETHYNLGLAYKDMGLTDDAVEEFQNAVKMVEPGDGTARYLQCCHLIGHCFMEKEMPKLAVIWFQRGIDAPGHSDDEDQALRYELGTAYERAGEKARALELFAGIYAVNVAYRSVGEKLRVLQAA